MRNWSKRDLMAFALWALRNPAVTASDVMARFGVSRATAHRWLADYRDARLRVEPWPQ